jgi:hypothetical protein
VHVRVCAFPIASFRSGVRTMSSDNSILLDLAVLTLDARMAIPQPVARVESVSPWVNRCFDERAGDPHVNYTSATKEEVKTIIKAFSDSNPEPVLTFSDDGTLWLWLMREFFTDQEFLLILLGALRELKNTTPPGTPGGMYGGMHGKMNLIRIRRTIYEMQTSVALGVQRELVRQQVPNGAQVNPLDYVEHRNRRDTVTATRASTAAEQPLHTWLCAGAGISQDAAPAPGPREAEPPLGGGTT